LGKKKEKLREKGKRTGFHANRKGKRKKEEIWKAKKERGQ